MNIANNNYSKQKTKHHPQKNNSLVSLATIIKIPQF